jgi:hypothetical protein
MKNLLNSLLNKLFQINLHSPYKYISLALTHAKSILHSAQILIYSFNVLQSPSAYTHIHICECV